MLYMVYASAIKNVHVALDEIHNRTFVLVKLQRIILGMYEGLGNVRLNAYIEPFSFSGVII